MYLVLLPTVAWGSPGATNMEILSSYEAVMGEAAADQTWVRLWTRVLTTDWRAQHIIISKISPSTLYLLSYFYDNNEY